MALPRLPIPRDELWRSLCKAAQVRAIVTMLSVLPSMVVVGLLLPRNQPDSPLRLMVFVGPLVVAMLMTRFYCRRRVLCPHCDASLWDCGTGNFKPRHMKIRDEVRECPSCHAPII